jgi:FkbM family methyltransferase
MIGLSGSTLKTFRDETMSLAVKSEWPVDTTKHDWSAGDWLRDGKRALRAVLPQAVLNWREMRYFAKYGEIELHVVDHLCRRDEDSIDIGANDGCYIHVMKKYSRYVHAFEPIPWLAQDLHRKFRRGVSIKQIALSNEPGNTVLHLPIVNGQLVPGCSSISAEASAYYKQHQEIPVRMEKLDDIYRGKAGFIKIDVEGHEESVLEGARQTIVRCQPRMLVEIDERLAENGYKNISKFFADLDYRGFLIVNRQVIGSERYDRATMQRPEDLPDLSARLEVRPRFARYIHNFLFFPAAEAEGLVRKVEARIATL